MHVLNNEGCWSPFILQGENGAQGPKGFKVTCGGYCTYIEILLVVIVLCIHRVPVYVCATAVTTGWCCMDSTGHLRSKPSLLRKGSYKASNNMLLVAAVRGNTGPTTTKVLVHPFHLFIKPSLNTHLPNTLNSEWPYTVNTILYRLSLCAINYRIIKHESQVVMLFLFLPFPCLPHTPFLRETEGCQG